MNHRLDIVILATVLLFAGCNETRVTSPKTRRPPADQGEVTIFQAPPREYQLLGTVRSDTEVTREKEFTAQPIIEELRAKSAAMGGNGVLLEVPGAETMKGVALEGGYYMDKFYRFQIEAGAHPHAFAQAIWVPDKYHRDDW